MNIVLDEKDFRALVHGQPVEKNARPGDQVVHILLSDIGFARMQIAMRAAMRQGAGPSIASTETRTPEEHRARHVELHRMFDELLADYLEQTGGSIYHTIHDLMQWSHAQTEQPTINVGSFLHPRPVPHT